MIPTLLPLDARDSRLAMPNTNDYPQIKAIRRNLAPPLLLVDRSLLASINLSPPKSTGPSPFNTIKARHTMRNQMLAHIAEEHRLDPVAACE